MDNASLDKMAGQTLDLGAEGFESAIDKVLAMPRIRDTQPGRHARHSDAR
jgi:hypothetical protein